MIIGVPAEVKNNENRVGLTPDSVKHLTNIGNEILVQDGAGTNIGLTNDLYISAGAKILDSAEDVYKSSEMIVKVKEPIPDEYCFLREDLTLFTYLHLAGDPENAKKLIDNKCICVCEGANMPSTPEAINLFHKNKILFAPGKASNAGGVAVSGLEMAQNSLRYNWSRKEVDEKLKTIMNDIHESCLIYGKSENYVNYVKGANIAGFVKVADAMLAQGVV